MKLGMWQRLGIVLSVLWMIGGGIWGLLQGTDAAMDAAVRFQISCEGQVKTQLGQRGCDIQSTELLRSENAKGRSAAAIVALAPIPVAWLLCYGAFWTVRWIARGRTPRSSV